MRHVKPQLQAADLERIGRAYARHALEAFAPPDVAHALACLESHVEARLEKAFGAVKDLDALDALDAESLATEACEDATDAGDLDAAFDESTRDLREASFGYEPGRAVGAGLVEALRAAGYDVVPRAFVGGAKNSCE